MSYKRYISQNDWVDAIMGLVENLDNEGKQELYNRMESEQYYRQPTREELEEKISELEDEKTELEKQITDLENELAESKED